MTVNDRDWFETVEEIEILRKANAYLFKTAAIFAEIAKIYQNRLNMQLKINEELRAENDEINKELYQKQEEVLQ